MVHTVGVVSTDYIVREFWVFGVLLRVWLRVMGGIKIDHDKYKVMGTSTSMLATVETEMTTEM